MNTVLSSFALIFGAGRPDRSAALEALGCLFDRVGTTPSEETAQIPLIFACVIAASALAARGGAAGLARLETNASRRIHFLPWAALAGSISGAAIAISQYRITGQAQAAEFLWVFLGAFLAAASFVDARTYWAPDELVLPCCILAGSVGILGCAGYWGIWGPVSGLAMWSAARLVWRLGVAGIRRLPPPDLVAAAMPLMLFGADIRSALAYFGCSSVLLAVGLSRSRNMRNCVRPFSARSSSPFGGRPVPFLGIALPMNLLAGLIG